MIRMKLGGHFIDKIGKVAAASRQWVKGIFVWVSIGTVNLVRMQPAIYGGNENFD